MAEQCRPLEEDGGYQYDYVEEPPDSLNCPICLLPCRRPHIVDCCGKKFCQTCIERIKYGGQPCPLCREHGFQSLIDRDHERRILSLKVRCNFKNDGCEWVGELRHIDRHLDRECHYVPVTCRFNCGHRCFRRDIRVHEEDECELRPMELILQKKVESLERKIVALDERCTNQDQLIAAQRETLDRQGALLEEQKAALEEQRKAIDAGQEEVREQRRVFEEQRGEVQRKLTEVEQARAQYKEEQEGAWERRLEEIEKARERVNEQLEEIRKLIEELKEEIENKLAQHKKSLEDLIEEKENDIVQNLEEQIKENSDDLTEQIQNTAGEIKELIEKERETSKAKMAGFENAMNEKGEGYDKKIEVLKESLQKRLDETKVAMDVTMKDYDKEVKEELMAAIDKKGTEISKSTLEKYNEDLKKMSVGFRVPEWQKPLPLTSFSSVPPCQFTMLHFKQHQREGKAWYSPPFYSEPGGYKLCLRIDPNGMLEGKESHLSVWVYVMKGRFDDTLKWPFTGKVTVQLLNWRADRGHIQNIVSFDDAAGEKVRARVTSGKYAATGRGSSKFVPHSMLAANEQRKTDFCFNDSLCFKISKVDVHV